MNKAADLIIRYFDLIKCEYDHHVWLWLEVRDRSPENLAWIENANKEYTNARSEIG